MLLMGKEVFLRPLQMSDATERFVSWMYDVEVTRYLEMRLQEWTLQGACEYVAQQMAKQDELTWAICLKSDGRHIGNIKLGPISKHHRSGDFSMFIGERGLHGRGIGTEVLGLASAYAIEQLGLNKLRGGVYSGNQASTGALQKVGYELEGVMKGQVFLDDVESDLLVYGLRAASYFARKKENEAAHVF